MQHNNGFLEATIDYQKVFFHYESVDVLSLAKVIWKDSLAQELLQFLLDGADNGGNRLYMCHTDINRKDYYFVKGSKLDKVLSEIVCRSNLYPKLDDFLSSDVYKQVVDYTKMSNAFFEMISLQEKMYKACDKLAHVKGYLAMFPEHRKLVELLDL